MRLSKDIKLRLLGAIMIELSDEKYHEKEDRTELPYSSDETVEPSQAEVDAAIDEYLRTVGL